ncbi:hypothetical protein [Arthrobacter methylotrophus]|uniref:Uncharacterized protein n=1 Tax=Arthrobacter methylotrophus TaxID=121291 RepID=A0ABV5UNJ4_9MICC
MNHDEGKMDTELTRDGETTLVRFVQHDSKLTAVMLSSGDYQPLPVK